MKKQTMYNRLQEQYNKLNSRIQKAIKTGRFYQLTQFKQDRLFGRLQRYSLQMKRVAAGVAVVTALGVSTPVMGQYPPPFVEQTGVNNPFGAFTIGLDYRSAFVDIDNDGDLDVFRPKSDPAQGNILITEYYENVGTVTSAVYIQRTGAANPMSASNFNNIIPSFVDIDNDGDYDCFAGAYYYKSNITMAYYLNTGTATNPIFTQQTVGNNPLNHAINTLGQGNVATTNFVDIDNDGDLDCFVGAYDYATFSREIWYYENTGTINSPIFSIQTGVNNPLDGASSVLQSSFFTISFHDMDYDGDKDAFIISEYGQHFDYFENTGSLSAPIFTANSSTPLANITTISDFANLVLVDIDGDADLDVCARFKGLPDTIKFFENTRVVGTNELEKESTTFNVQPNPTPGIVNFDKLISGKVTLFNIFGQEIWAKSLEFASVIDLSMIDDGIYFLEIKSDQLHTSKKIQVKK